MNTMNKAKKSVTSSREAYQGLHYLSPEISISGDTWRTGLNNNALLFGPSGAGKTRGYVRPNIELGATSMIISDTKGSLYESEEKLLREMGYQVLNLDLAHMKGNCGYNPLDYIRFDDKGEPREQDILRISHTLIQTLNSKEPYWDFAARQFVEMLICYVLQELPPEDHTLESVGILGSMMGSEKFQLLMEEMLQVSPDSAAARRYLCLKDVKTAEKMFASITGILNTNLNALTYQEAVNVYNHPSKVDFKEFGKRKVALFLTISDTDRSLDSLANLFMTQALQCLCESADVDYPEHMLPVPVRLYLDDFATNLYIADFDKIISVIRSREIYVSVILQSLTQLAALYGESRAMTILNNCDQQLYLGGQDPSTAAYIAQRVNRPMSSILNLPKDKTYLLLRGEEPQIVDKL